MQMCRGGCGRMSHGEYCYRCAGRIKVSVTCPRCGKSRLVSRKAFQDTQFTGMCGSCATITGLEKAGVIKRKEPVKRGSEKVLIRCPICKKFREVTAKQAKDLERENHFLCRTCSRNSFVKASRSVWLMVGCPTCGKSHQLRMFDVNRGVTSCLVCRKAISAQSRAMDRDKKMARRVAELAGEKIHINGCTLVPAFSGRCRDFIHCEHGSHANLNDIPREKDCCYQVGLRDWPGFTCVKEDSKCGS